MKKYFSTFLCFIGLIILLFIFITCDNSTSTTNDVIIKDYGIENITITGPNKTVYSLNRPFNISGNESSLIRDAVRLESEKPDKTAVFSANLSLQSLSRIPLLGGLQDTSIIEYRIQPVNYYFVLP